MKTAQFIIAQNADGLFAARRAPGANCRRFYLPGGAIGERETLESVCSRQGWNINRGELVHSEITQSGYKAEWFSGTARPVKRINTAPHWVTKATIEQSDHLHDDAFYVFEALKGA